MDNYGSDTDSASETWREQRHKEDDDLEASKKVLSQHISRKERYILMGQEQDKQNQQLLKIQSQSQAQQVTKNSNMNMEIWLREQEKERQRSGKSPAVSLERLNFEGESEKLTSATSEHNNNFGSDFNNTTSSSANKRGPGRPVKRNR